MIEFFLLTQAGENRSSVQTFAHAILEPIAKKLRTYLIRLSTDIVLFFARISNAAERDSHTREIIKFCIHTKVLYMYIMYKQGISTKT